MSDARSLILKWLCAAILLGACGAVAAADAPAPPPPPAPPAASARTPAPAATPALPIKPDEVLTHVGKTVDWYRGLQSLEQIQGTPQDLLSRARLQEESRTAVRLAFDFGHASAAILRAGAADDSTAPAATGFAGQLDQMTDRVAQRVTMLQAQLADLDAKLEHARGTAKSTLTAQRGDVSAALALVREVQSSMQDMERFESYALSSDSSGEGGLGTQISALEKSVPEAARAAGTSAGRVQSANASSGGASSAGASGVNGPGGKPPNSAATSAAGGSAAAATAAAAPAFHPESAGVIALATQWFALHSTHRQLTGAFKQTGSLLDEVNDQRRTITGAVRNVLRDAFGSSTSDDPGQLNAHKAVLEAGAAQFKKLSTVLVPLGEQALTLESAQGTLTDWRGQVGERADEVSRYLALRVGFLLASIAIVLAISEVWRRATFRYLHDTRRRRQFLVLRRVAVGVTLTVVILFELVSELGSVATYAGFVTAGIAVALQNVILAVVAYFFLIGRYGVRVGDRITLAGVTGRVVDIGLVRIYLMELSGPELHSTGRIVVLSNAVLFQPTAMFKQIPGAEYVWHTITLTLDASADVVEANKRLKAAADGVYAKYRSGIERQYAVMQRLLEFDTSTPAPEVRVRWTESGLQCAVRYPVEPENSASVDQQMLKALRDALAKDPPLKLLSAEPVALKSSDS